MIRKCVKWLKRFIFLKYIWIANAMPIEINCTNIANISWMNINFRTLKLSKRVGFLWIWIKKIKKSMQKSEDARCSITLRVAFPIVLSVNCWQCVWCCQPCGVFVWPQSWDLHSARTGPALQSQNFKLYYALFEVIQVKDSHDPST